MEIEIKKLSPYDIEDFVKLISVFESVFEWENFSFPPISHLQKVLNNPHFFVFVATSEQKVVGGLTAYVLEMYETEKPSAYIYDLAITTENQRKGIGKLLIAHVNAYCEKNGFGEVFVHAEMEDLEAVSFYKKTQPSNELNATHFTYSFEIIDK